jgi:hypothetical protein
MKLVTDKQVSILYNTGGFSKQEAIAYIKKQNALDAIDILPYLQDKERLNELQEILRYLVNK